MGRKKGSAPSSGVSSMSSPGSSIPDIHKNPVVVLQDIVKQEVQSSDDEMDSRSTVSASRRLSGRARKTYKKTVKDVDNSGGSDGEDGDDGSGSDFEVVESTKGKRKTAAKTGGGKKAGPASRKRRQSSPPRISTSKSKKPRKGSDGEESPQSEEDEDEASEKDQDGSEDDGEDADDSPKKTKTAGRGRKAVAATNGDSGKGAGAEDDDEENMNFHIEDEDTDDDDWEEPNYTKPGWLKKNCLICQFCKKTYEETGKALNCFHGHKDKLRCYLCFYIIKGGKMGTKRLFRHYEKRHEQGAKKYSLKCVHCDEEFPYKSMSCHIIAVHFREALGIPQKNAPGNKNGSVINGKQAVRASKKNSKNDKELSDVDEGSDEDKTYDDEKEPEDKEKTNSGNTEVASDDEEEEKDSEEEEDEEKSGGEEDDEEEEEDDDDDDGNQSD